MNTVDFDTKAEAWDAHTARVKRAEKIYDSIAAEISIHASDRVLDFGCGTGLLGFHFINAVTRVTFADTSAGMLEQVRKKAELLPKGKADTLNLTGATEYVQYYRIAFGIAPCGKRGRDTLPVIGTGCSRRVYLSFRP